MKELLKFNNFKMIINIILYIMEILYKLQKILYIINVNKMKLFL